ncbi:MAG: hypothetical protein ABIR57_04685 [Aeromicrobium sp.]
MEWTWKLEKEDSTVVGTSEPFDSRSDAESWVGEAFAELLDDGIDQVRLFEGDKEVYGPMSLHTA